MNVLTGIAESHNVRILCAVEAGSRAWGFASPDSDYDVRFIYVRPLTEYIKTSVPRDTIEVCDGDIDASGWDIIKAARLLRKSNPSLMEWLQSPIVYVDRESLLSRFYAEASMHASARAAVHHYISMAKTNFRAYIQGRERVRLKKYLYAVRPILCARHVLDNSNWPPVEFDDLLKISEAPNYVINATFDLLNLKLAGSSELDESTRMPVLDQYLEDALNNWHHEAQELPSSKFPAQEVDKIICDIVYTESITELQMAVAAEKMARFIIGEKPSLAGVQMTDEDFDNYSGLHEFQTANQNRVG